MGLYSTFNREVLKIWKPVRLIENSIVIVNILVSIKRTGFKIFKTVLTFNRELGKFCKPVRLIEPVLIIENSALELSISVYFFGKFFRPQAIFDISFQ